MGSRKYMYFNMCLSKTMFTILKLKKKRIYQVDIIRVGLYYEAKKSRWWIVQN